MGNGSLAGACFSSAIALLSELSCFFACSPGKEFFEELTTCSVFCEFPVGDFWVSFWGVEERSSGEVRLFSDEVGLGIGS